MADYRVDVYDTSGSLQGILTDFTHLAFTRRVNQLGTVELSLSGSHALLSDLADKWQFEVWRKPSGGSWTREIVGIYRYIKWEHPDRSIATLICDGIVSMLGWRIVNWKAGITDRSKFISKPAETIANTLVKYNATSDATVANGRIREGAISGLTVETNGEAGNTLDWFCAYDNLLETLQDLVRVGGGDFDLVKTSPTAYQWRWYENQLGSDKTDSIIFAMERGNMANPVYIDDRRGEKTVATVGGKGEESEREVIVRTGSNYSSGNDIETFVAATDVDTTVGLQTRGDQKLNELKAIRSFGFDVLQTEGCRYGIDYGLGDLVTAINPFTGGSLTVKVEGITAGFESEGSEAIEVNVKNV